MERARAAEPDVMIPYQTSGSFSNKNTSAFTLTILSEVRTESGDLRPRPHGGGQTRHLSDKHLKVLRQEVARSPNKTTATLRDHLEERADDRDPHALSRLGLSRKKSGGE